jgi:hypothetical protein
MKPLYALAFLAVLPVTGRAADLNFNRDVRPILAENCFPCHGFDAKARKAKLRLDLPEGAFAERKGVTPIKPGDPAGSEVWARVSSDDPEVVMPPPATNKKLDAKQKETLRRWIEQGAKYQKHWAFETPTRPAAPDPRNPIDSFIRARLAKEGLTPAPEADRETLIRRAAFALTGLPPTVKEVDEFLADRSPNAYGRMVDRYLASPRFGEEMARHWLDVARYADTHGLHLDNERQMWAYRDWVVRAFNDNLPFDRFTIWQVAGDLLPNPTSDQLTATGFNRCNVTTAEGGALNAEFLYRYAVDRASTTAEAFLGLTAGCAVCHDHKYDPISQKEFYSLYAFFYSAADPGLDGNVNNTAPFVTLPTPAQKKAIEAAAKAEADTARRLEQAARAADYDDPAGETPAPARRPVRDVLFDDAFAPGAADRNTSRNAADWVADPEFGAHSGRRVLRQASGSYHEDTLQFQARPVVVPAAGALEAWVRLDPGHVPAAVAVRVNGPGGQRRVWWGKEDLDNEEFAGGGKVASAESVRLGPLPEPGRWVKLAVPAERFGLKAGQRLSALSVQQVGGVVWWDAVALVGETDPAADPLESFQAWWKGKKAPPELPADLRPLVTGGPDKQHPAEAVDKLRAYYLAYVARPMTGELAEARRAWEQARAAHQIADTAPPGTMIFRDLDKPRDAFVMLRGQYDKPGEKVTPAVPAVLPSLKTDKPDARLTRLDLARWLVAPENPLTARVTVNRVWQQFFGTGLVKTSFDFGTQGEPPSHPELLDYLAVEFRESGWDVKRFVRLLVTSEAFRRQSRSTPELRQRDPANRLYARGPRFRLDAEQVRDNALFVSGLINLRMGGRGVQPYQPPNVWEPVGYADSNTRYYLQDHGPALYRRSLYVFLKRTAPPPFLTNFDGSNREQFCTLRDRTNTPLQALQLMNDVQHFEAARALAERTVLEGGPTTEDRITFLYRTVLSRRPDVGEAKIVADALAKQLVLYRADPAAAERAVRAGESAPKNAAPAPETAAWTLIASLILNLDETLNRN